MLRAGLLAGVLAAFVAPSPSAFSQVPNQAGTTSAFERLFAQPWLHTNAYGNQSVISYTWVVPGSEYEHRSVGQTRDTSVTRWTIHPDGSMSGVRGSEKLSGRFDEAGLPVVVFEHDGKEMEARLEPHGEGYSAVSFQNQAAPGQPAQWKEYERSQRRPLSMAEATVLTAQLREAHAGRRPAAAQDEPLLRRHVAAILARTPLYGEMTPAFAAWMRQELEKWPKDTTLGPLQFVRYSGTDEQGFGLFGADHAFSGALWGLKLDGDGRVSNMNFKAQPKKNELRETPGGRGWPHAKATIDDLRMGGGAYGFLEPTDGYATGFGWRGDCYRIVAAPGKHLRLTVRGGGADTRAAVIDNCEGYWNEGVVASSVRQDDFVLRFTVPGGPSFVWLEGKAKGRSYRLDLAEMTAAEVAQWNEDRRQARMAQQQREAQQGDNTFSRALGGALMGAMLGGGGQDSVDLAVAGAQSAAQGGNALEVLNSMGSVAAANQAESERQLNETIRQAQNTGSGGAVGPTTPGGGATTAGADTSGPSVPAASAQPGPPIRFYFMVPVTPVASDTRNPMCYSNVVTLSQRLDADTWTRGAKARPFVEPYWETFLEKCGRLGNVEGRGVYTIEHLDAGWPAPEPHPTDRRVTLP